MARGFICPTVLLTPPWLGYVQGMSDLCAPVYVVMGGGEEMTFWCFVEIMNRMVRGPPVVSFCGV